MCADYCFQNNVNEVFTYKKGTKILHKEMVVSLIFNLRIICANTSLRTKLKEMILDEKYLIVNVLQKQNTIDLIQKN